MADDIGLAIGGGRDEAVVGGLLVPAGRLRVGTGALLGIVVVEDEALVVDAIGVESRDQTVGIDLGGESTSHGKRVLERRHACFLMLGVVENVLQEGVKRVWIPSFTQ